MQPNYAGYTLADLIDRHCVDDAGANRTAFRLGDQTLTYAGLRDAARRVANALIARGVVKGDRVALLTGNRLEWIELYFGIIAAGAIVVPINILLQGRDVNRVLAVADPKVLVVDDVSQSTLSNIDRLPELVVVVGDAGTGDGRAVVSYRSLTDGFDSSQPEVDIDASSPAMMYFTSGTTGIPKGAVHTHNTVLWNTFHQIRDLEISSDERFLIVPSLTWGAGLHDVTLALMWAGGQSSILPTGNRTLERIVDVVCEHGITRALLVPTLLKELLARADLVERVRGSTLRRAMSGAEPLYAETIEALARQLPDLAITQTYGMTEFPMIATVTTPDDARLRPGTAGRASSITTLAIRTLDDRIVANGSGEIVFRSPATTVGYFGDPTTTATAFRDGWFHSGDLGTLDDDGYLTVTGRLKDMIVSGGLNIYPREIESLLQQIPGALEVAVIGKPSERWGEIPVAVVVRDPAVDLTSEDVLEFCGRELSGFRCPKEAVVTTDPLPKTVTGKIRKQDIAITRF